MQTKLTQTTVTENYQAATLAEVCRLVAVQADRPGVVAVRVAPIRMVDGLLWVGPDGKTWKARYELVVTIDPDEVKAKPIEVNNGHK